MEYDSAKVSIDKQIWEEMPLHTDINENIDYTGEIETQNSRRKFLLSEFMLSTSSRTGKLMLSVP